MTRHIFTCEPGWEKALLAELSRVFPTAKNELLAEGWVGSEGVILPAGAEPCVAFAAQCLPDALGVSAASISKWAAKTTDLVIEALSASDGRWRLHVFSPPTPGGPVAPARCRLIAAAIGDAVKKKRRRLWRALARDANVPPISDESLVQVGLVSAGTGFWSCCSPDRRQSLRRCVSRFANGEVLVAPDRRAPSRAFAKLVEVETRLGRQIASGETCIDLGSSPGSWAWLALARGAAVTTVDRSPLRADLMEHPRLKFVRGDAFRFQPAAPVDWLLCDVIAYPGRTLELLRTWLAHGWCRWFCVSVKFKGAGEYARLEEIKSWLAAAGVEFFVRRLTSNKNEVMAFGGTDRSIRATL